MSAKNPIQDRVAIIGVGTTAYERGAGDKTMHALGVEAARNAILDAGVKREEIDGICNSTPLGGEGGLTPQSVQEGLGIPALTWWANLSHGTVVAFNLAECVNAVFSGACSMALAVHAVARTGFNSSSMGADPIRARQAQRSSVRIVTPIGLSQYYAPYAYAKAGYAGFMNRYMHQYGAKREHFGLAAINMRTNAASNDHAVMRKPLSMQDYLKARYVREPMCMLDMDLPVDGADAFIVTTLDRARDLRKPPVLIHATSHGQAEHSEDDQAIDLRHIGQRIAARALWEKSELRASDADVLFLYDGYTVIVLNWLESLGYCAPGEAGPFIESNWQSSGNRMMIGGRVPVNPHGGSLSEGASQGAGHLREAVYQLRGEAGARQVANCRTAVAGLGGLFFNSSAMVLRAL